MKGIQDLIRPCATLARYEAALAAGTITQDVMVFIADVRQIRWKGEIYDCSVTAVTEEGKTFIHADGLNDSNDGYYFLPSSAPADDPEHTFAMLSDLEGIEGGNGNDNVVTFYAPIDSNSISDMEKQHNAESHQKVAQGFESDKYYDIKVLLSTSQLVALDVIKTINPAIDNGRLKLIFGGAGSGIDLQMLTVTSDGRATTEKVEEGSALEIDSELSDTSENAVQNKAIKAYIDNAITNTINTPV